MWSTQNTNLDLLIPRWEITAKYINTYLQKLIKRKKKWIQTHIHFLRFSNISIFIFFIYVSPYLFFYSQNHLVYLFLLIYSSLYCVFYFLINFYGTPWVQWEGSNCAQRTSSAELEGHLLCIPECLRGR